jgi:cytochrome c peroxidase
MTRLALVFAVFIAVRAANAAAPWNATELAELRQFSLQGLGPLPVDSSNRFADDPRAAEFGRKLFFDPRLSSNGRVSCATCHVPERGFQDGHSLSQGVGTTSRRAMPIAGTAHLPFLFWDGRKDSQWAQALGPLENPAEHGGTRAQYAHIAAERYRAEYEAVFGALPDLSAVPRVAGPVADPAAAQAWRQLSDEQRDAVSGVFVNLGKAIAAYERRIEVEPARFDAYLESPIATGRAHGERPHTRGRSRPPPVPGQGELHPMPQWSFVHQWRFPQYRCPGPVDSAGGSRSPPRRPTGADGRIQPA